MPSNPSTALKSTSPAKQTAISLAIVVLLGMAIGGGWIVSQVRMAPSAVPAEMSVQPQAGKAKRSLTAGTHDQMQRSGSGPAWTSLTRIQRQVLAPLEARWSSMGELTKRRWMSLADGFDQLQPEDQEKLHKRMQTWASLSVQQRNQARLNFYASRQLTTDDLQAKWDEYQALTEEEKRRLAAKAAPKTGGAATVTRPQTKRKLASIPAATVAAPTVANLPKILHPAPGASSAPLPHANPSTPAASVIAPPPPPVAQPAPIVVPQSQSAITLPPLSENAPLENRAPPTPTTYAHPDFTPIHPPQ